MGGLRLVGERGPELEATGAARYYSAEETASAMAMGATMSHAMYDQMKEMRRETQELNARMYVAMRKMADDIEEMKIEGFPVYTETGQTVETS